MLISEDAPARIVQIRPRGLDEHARRRTAHARHTWTPARQDGGVVEVAVLVGLQASGKTTFYRARLAATHVHVSKDLFRKARRKQARQLRLVAEALDAGRDVAVDNTNPSPDEWAPLIEVGRRFGARTAAYWFPPDVALSMRRNALRPAEIRVPDVGVYATLKRLRRPGPGDGFDELWTVRPDGRGGFAVAPMETDEAQRP